jgi:hypothetical protein
MFAKHASYAPSPQAHPPSLVPLRLIGNRHERIDFVGNQDAGVCVDVWHISIVA